VISYQDRGDRPGQVKIQHPPCAHDDIVTAVGMVVADLIERSEGRGWVLVPRTVPVLRTLIDAHPALPSLLAVRSAARKMPRGE
jgi:hypothetical protein